MTRINSAIPVQHLTDEHLLAEHREIKRLPYCLRQAIQSGSIKRVPEAFTLGKGHVTFFLDKMQFTRKRYMELHLECQLRGMNVEDYSGNWAQIPFGQRAAYFNDYSPTIQEHGLLTERITARIMESRKQTWHYYGRPITKQQAAKLLTK